MKNFLKKTGPLARLFLLACCSLACEKKEAPPSVDVSGDVYLFKEPHMGTMVTIQVWVPADGGEEAVSNCSQVTRRAFDRIAELNGVFSDYLVESELSMLSKAPANQAIPVSDELLDILQRAGKVYEASEGAFDVTIGPMIRLWRRSRKDLKLPTELQIANARERIGFEKVQIDPEMKTVTKSVENLVFDLGGIAKGYAADEALRVLQEGGFRHCLVAASGDIALGDAPPGSKRGGRSGIDTLEMAQPGENSFFAGQCRRLDLGRYPAFYRDRRAALFPYRRHQHWPWFDRTNRRQCRGAQCDNVRQLCHRGEFAGKGQGDGTHRADRRSRMPHRDGG